MFSKIFKKYICHSKYLDSKYLEYLVSYNIFPRALLKMPITMRREMDRVQCSTLNRNYQTPQIALLSN